VDRNVAWGLKAAVIEAGYDVDVAEALLEEHSPADHQAGMFGRS
jgi:hypothetical protein